MAHIKNGYVFDMYIVRLFRVMQKPICLVFLCKNINDTGMVLLYFLLSFIIRWEKLVEEEFNSCHDMDIFS